MRQKKRSGNVDMEMPLQVQMKKSYVESLKICQHKHGSTKQSKFYKECDAVTESLTREKVTMLDIAFEKILSDMRPVVRSSPAQQSSSLVANNKPQNL